MTSELHEIITRVKATLDTADTSQQGMRAHLKWAAGQMVTALTPDKLTTLELAALAAVLHSAHARVLDGPTGSRPTLTVVPTEDAAELSETAG